MRRPQAVANANAPGVAARLRGSGPLAALSMVRSIAEIVLVVVLAALAARLFWLVFAPLPLPQGDPAAAAGPVADAAPIMVKSPFGAAELASAEPASPAAGVAETTLNLALTGVWASDDAPSAAIRTPDGKQARYVVGDEIIDGVTLEAVFHDQVTIRRAGIREALRFETKETRGAERRPAPSNNNSARKASAPSLRDGAGSVGARSVGAGGLASIFRVAPATTASGGRAIELYAARNRQAFEAFGFRDGDRLVSIDGAPPPSNPAALSSVLSNLQRKSSALLVVERDGKEIPIKVSLDNVQGK